MTIKPPLTGPFRREDVPEVHLQDEPEDDWYSVVNHANESLNDFLCAVAPYALVLALAVIALLAVYEYLMTAIILSQL